MRFLPLLCIGASVGIHTGLWLAYVAPQTELQLPPNLVAITELVVEAPAAPAVAPVVTPPVAPIEREPEPAPADAVASWTPPADAIAAPPARAATAPSAAAATPNVSTQPSADATPGPAPEPPSAAVAASAKPEVAAPPVAAAEPLTPQWRPTGPPPGLRLPAAVRTGKPAADLVIDPRDRTFRDRAKALGMTFIVFQDGALSFFLELTGDDLRTAQRRTGLDAETFSRRARDLAGVAAFDRLRDDVAGRYGLDPARCRLAALVPNHLDATFRATETAALAAMRKATSEVRALCGTLTGDDQSPLRIDRALLADGRWLEVTL